MQMTAGHPSSLRTPRWRNKGQEEESDENKEDLQVACGEAEFKEKKIRSVGAQHVLQQRQIWTNVTQACSASLT